MYFTSNKKRRNLKALQSGTLGVPHSRCKKIFGVNIPCFYIGILMGGLIRTQYICTCILHTQQYVGADASSQIRVYI
jgi:hypothetical protein